MQEQYLYLLASLFLFIVWLVLFIWRKDVRKQMLLMSFLFAFAGLIVELAYIKDWWKPLTITNTPIGVEDFIFGFAFGGVASVVYEELFKQRIRKRKETEKTKATKTIHFALFASLLPLIFYTCVYALKLNTFISTILGFGIPTLIIYVKRRDLILDSLASGLIMLILSFIVYSVLEFLSPGWVYSFWFFQNVPPVIILNVPIDDVVWYVMAGAFIAPLYEFWWEAKLVKLRKRKEAAQ